MSAEDLVMPAAEVERIIGWLEARDVTYQVNGGWAVDALVGHQTRTHRDLDVFLDADDVDDLLSWLADRGYEVIENQLPVRVELVAAGGRVDVHPMTVQANGDGVQQGLGDQTFVHTATDRTSGIIGQTSVTVASASRLRELRRGYVPRDVDRHDVAMLDCL